MNVSTSGAASRARFRPLRAERTKGEP